MAQQGNLRNRRSHSLAREQEITTKFLCLAYGDDKKWNTLSKSKQEALRAQDDVLRSKGNVVAAVQTATTLRFTDGNVRTIDGPLGQSKIPLAGFYILHVKDIDEVIGLLSKTPCAYAGAIEVRPIEEHEFGGHHT